ncbi:MAG: PspC domain-containing protein, partial [Actinomycetota bacterium]|nr:PspC domain-containing protein [Actinomycetota bacterium]
MNQTNPPRRLVRSRDDRFVGGVAAGIANYFNLDPVLIRVAFVISIAFGGIGVLAYLALLVLVPVDGDPEEPVERPTGTKRALVIGGTIVLGFIALASIDGAGFGGWFFGIGPGPLFGILIWALAIAGVIWLVREATDGDNATSGAFGRPQAPPVPPAPATRTAEAETTPSAEGQDDP